MRCTESASSEKSLPKKLNNVFSSLHTHTLFCDGRDDVETMCRTAFEKGLAAIGFSAHAPMGKTGLSSDWHIEDGRLEEYAGEVRAARRRWEGKIPVYLGLEVDYIKGLRSALDDDIRGLGLDYVIGSTHYVIPPRGAPFTVDGPAQEVERGISEGFGGDGEAMMHAYWDAVGEMIALGGIDIVGHLDLVKKNNRANRWFSTEGETYRQRLEEIARALATGGFVVEASTGAMNRGHLTETYPSLPALRLLQQHGVPVTISADAHRAADLDGHYHAAHQILLDAGYDSHVVFEGREDGKPVWRKWAL